MGRWDCKSLESASVFLCERAVELSKNDNTKKIIIIGDNSLFSTSVVECISNNTFEVAFYNIENLENQLFDHMTDISCIICSCADSKNISRTAHFVLNNDKLNLLPFECMPIPNLEFDCLLRRDVRENTDFVSPLLTQNIPLFEIYEESLKLFEMKFEIRDYMDFFQLLKNVIDNNVEGDIAEFGSYKGHSGYLISRLLNEMKTNKHLYMFDTFENFPVEHGIDNFWSNTHQVDFNEVINKFKDIPNVSLIKGDFTKTFDSVDIKKLSIVYIDCDSYRATKYLIKQIYPTILSKGGVMIFEDYGHASLLGVRLAVHECFDDVKGCVKFFSQFSGFYFVFKS